MSMNALSYISLSLFIASVSFAQTKTDTTLATYLKIHGYVALSDTAHLPKTIMPYYAEIMHYLSERNPDKKACYVRNYTDESNILIIPLLSLQGIIADQKWHEQMIINEAHPIVVNGKKTDLVELPPLGINPGNDCELRIDKISRKMSIWRYQ